MSEGASCQAVMQAVETEPFTVTCRLGEAVAGGSVTGVLLPYCGWTKSCTSLKPWQTGEIPGLVGGAVFRPSTVWLT